MKKDKRYRQGVFRPNNIEKYIPNDCFIDRSNFSSNDELYKFMKSMTEKEFVAMQNNIVNFLSILK